MIPKSDLHEQTGLYLYNNKVWKILGYCLGPSVTMECLSDRGRIDFGLGGALEKEFKLIKEVEE